MPQQKSMILFSGNESPQEMAYKLMEMQKQLDNRISTIEKKSTETINRLDQLED